MVDYGELIFLSHSIQIMPISYKIVHMKNDQEEYRKKLAEKGRQLYIQYVHQYMNLKNDHRPKHNKLYK